MKLAYFRMPVLFLTAFVFIGVSYAAETVPRFAAPPPFLTQNTEGLTAQMPPIEKLGGGKYRLGEIFIDKTERSISFPAQVNMDKGLLEYLLVQNKGKTHESLLRTRIDPHNLQIAFMLLGYEGTDQRLSMQGAPETPKGERINITVMAPVAGKTVFIGADQWLSIKDGEKMKNTGSMNWVFCGSYVDYGRFMAQESGSIIAIYHDPVALIDNASPGGESDKVWFVKEGSVPPVGTQVTVTISPAK